MLNWCISSSNSNSYRIKIPKYHGKHGHHFTMWMTKMKEYVSQQKLSPILLDTFKASLPGAEDTVLNETDTDNQKEQKVLEMNVKEQERLSWYLRHPK